MYLFLIVFVLSNSVDPDKMMHYLTFQWRSQNAEKVTHIKGRLLDQAVNTSIVSLLLMGTSLKGKNLLSAGANSFLQEQLLMAWKITFTTLGDLP